MIVTTKAPLSDPEREQLQQWLNDPARMIYQRCLASQAAELTAEGAAIILERTHQDPEAEARERFDRARVLIAAKKFLDEGSIKDYKFYVVSASPMMPTKN